jgi:tRNA-intron endonuclease
MKGKLWFAIVDEEGDITYYDVALSALSGEIPEGRYPQGTGILLENRVVLFDQDLAHVLLDKEFYGKSFGNGLQLSLVEALYLVENKVLGIRVMGHKGNLSEKEFMTRVKQVQPDIEARLLVFKDLKNRGLIVKTGFKFGAHFRAYTTNPDETHAEYLIHVVTKGFESIWAEMSRAVRLAHSVNKDIIFARIDGTKVDYIKFGRLRP